MNQDNLTLYAYNFTSRAERVIWALDELGLEYELIRLDPFKGDIFTEEFTALNPDRKVPVLVHQGKSYTESLAIMEYADTLSGKTDLVPPDPDSLALYRHIMYYTATELETYLWIADQCTRLKMIYSWPEGTLDSTLKRVKSNIRTLFTRIGEHEYLAGNNFSAADIYAWQIVGWAAGYGIDVPDHVHQYLDRLSKRPSFPPEMKANPNL